MVLVLACGADSTRMNDMQGGSRRSGGADGRDSEGVAGVTLVIMPPAVAASAGAVRLVVETSRKAATPESVLLVAMLAPAVLAVEPAAAVEDGAGDELISAILRLPVLCPLEALSRDMLLMPRSRAAGEAITSPVSNDSALTVPVPPPADDDD